MFITFHFVTIGWVLFRAPDVATAMKIVTSLGAGLPRASIDDVYPIVLVVIALAMHRFDTHAQMRRLALWLRGEVMWPLLALLWMLAIAVSQGSSSKFIYFDF